MYNRYFGFRQRPFRLVPDPDFLFLSRSHEEALAQMKYAAMHGDGFAVIVGEVGTGKTMLCRAFLESLDQEIESAYIFNPKVDAAGLLASICAEFGIKDTGGKSVKELIDLLNKFLISIRASGKKAVLVIDEAQNLTPDVLEQIRLLSNLETTREKLIQIILAGQPELEEMLDSYDLRQLAQRISLFCHICPFNFHETKNYIEHRIHRASDTPYRIFSRGAVKKIYRYSGGIPRLINIACDRSLIAAYGYGKKKVNSRIAGTAISELVRTRHITGKNQVPGLVTAGLLAIIIAAGSYVMWRSVIAADKKVIPAGKLGGTTLEDKARSEANQVPAVQEQNLLYPVKKTEKRKSAAFEVREDSRKSENITGKKAKANNEGGSGSMYALQNSGKNIKPEKPGGYADDSAVSAATNKIVSLRELLDGINASESRNAALFELFSLWKVPFDMASTFSELENSIKDTETCFTIASRRAGMELLVVKNDLEKIDILDLPVIIGIKNDKESTGSYLCICKKKNGLYLACAGTGKLCAWIDPKELARVWDGRAYIFWKDFYNYRGTIPGKAPGDAVLTLKLHLRSLGYKDIPITPEYDDATRAAVLHLQAIAGITTDGIVGPETKIILYNKTASLVLPHLAVLDRPSEILNKTGSPQPLTGKQ